MLMSFVICLKKQPKIRVLCGIILPGPGGLQDHGLEKGRMDSPRLQRRHPNNKPEPPPIPPLPPAEVCRT